MTWNVFEYNIRTCRLSLFGVRFWVGLSPQKNAAFFKPTFTSSQSFWNTWKSASSAATIDSEHIHAPCFWLHNFSDIYANMQMIKKFYESCWYVRCRCRIGQLSFIFRLWSCSHLYGRYLHHVLGILERLLVRWVVCTTPYFLRATLPGRQIYGWSISSERVGTLDGHLCERKYFLFHFGYLLWLIGQSTS